MPEYIFIGLTKLGTDIVKNLTIVEDPDLVYRSGDNAYFLKKWEGKFNGAAVTVSENVQLIQNNGSRMLIFSSLFFKTEHGTSEVANWVLNPLLDNTVKEYNYETGQINFRV